MISQKCTNNRRALAFKFSSQNVSKILTEFQSFIFFKFLNSNTILLRNIEIVDILIYSFFIKEIVHSPSIRSKINANVKIIPSYWHHLVNTLFNFTNFFINLFFHFILRFDFILIFIYNNTIYLVWHNHQVLQVFQTKLETFMSHSFLPHFCPIFKS